MLIYVVRHGQTNWNAEGRLQGQQDILLNETGYAQATGNGEKLAILLAGAGQFDFIASPLTRTRQTMELILGALGYSTNAYRTDDRLLELSFGDWEGRTIAEVFQLDPDHIHERLADKWNFVPPGVKAESYAILSRRVASWMKTVKKPTVCVCHGGVIRCLFKLTGTASPEEAAHMDVPQDRILRFENRKLDWI